ncbi:MAG: phosphoribosylanthranilate isomerase [Gemmatimonadaceae bacterium]
MLAKICGLTRPSDAELAESFGADFLGVIMAGGPRHLTEVAASHVLGAPRHGVRRVVVFGTQPREEIAGIAVRLRLDVIQLHSHANASDIKWLQERTPCAVWPVLRVDGTTIPGEAVRLGGSAGSLLLDARVVGQLGGTGVALDWRGLASAVDALRHEMSSLQIILAGGLNPKNVREARSLLSADVVDVSSGVESAPGIKNTELMKAFLLAAHATEPAINERA